MKRRNVLAMLTGAALGAPQLLGAQQKRIPKVAVILATSAAEGDGLSKAFESAWPALGWINGKTIQIDYHWAPPALLLDCMQRQHRASCRAGRIHQTAPRPRSACLDTTAPTVPPASLGAIERAGKVDAAAAPAPVATPTPTVEP